MRRGRRSTPSQRSAESRGSGSATAISGFTSSARRRCAAASRSPSMTARLARASGSRAADARDRRPAADVALDPRPASFTFQEWFVARGHRDEVDAVCFEGADAARPRPACSSRSRRGSAPARAEQPVRVVGADPRRRPRARGARTAFRALRRRQPADRRPRGQGARRPDARAPRGRHLPRHVAGCYEGLIDSIVVDRADAQDLDGLGGVRPVVTSTLMRDGDARRRLAEAVLGAVPA